VESRRGKRSQFRNQSGALLQRNRLLLLLRQRLQLQGLIDINHSLSTTVLF
jgi:hypothetical protein